MPSPTTLLADRITRPALAVELNCHPRTIRRYENEPDGLPFVMIAGRKYYRVAAVLDWLNRRETKPNPTRQRRAVLSSAT